MKLTKNSLAVAISAAIFSSSNPAFAQNKGQNQQLPTIVVTPQNTNQTAESVTGNLSVITSEEIEQNQYRNLKDALTHIPGVQVSSTGGLGHQTSIYIRGSDKILLLFDGVPLNDPTSTRFSANFEAINLQDVERIEVLKGASSGVWGANASAGVINIISKSGQHGSSGNVNFAMGSDNFHQVGGGFTIKDENGDITTRFNNIKTDGFSQLKPYKSNERKFEKDGFDQSDFLINFGINFKPNHRVETLVKNTQMNADYDSPYAGHENDATSERNVNTLLRQVSYKYNLNNIDLKLHLNKLDIVRDEGYGDMESDRTEQFIALGYQYSDKNYIQVFTQANQSRYEGKDLKLKNESIGITNTAEVNGLVLTQSLRHDLYNEFDNKTTGSFGMATDLTADVRFSSNIGTSYTSPSLYQLTQGVTNNLKPEQAVSWDLKLGLWDFDLTLFKSTVKDLIDYGGSWPSDYYFNSSGETKFEGVEFEYKKHYQPINTFVAFSTNYLEAKDQDNNDLARRAKNISTLDLTFNGIDKTTVNIASRYVGSKYDYRSGGKQQIGKYFVTDLSVNYELNKMISLNAKVINLFNQDYTDAVDSAIGSTPTYVYSNGGRQFFVKLSANF